MIWAILAFLGVPLWLCAAGILWTIFNNRRLRKRPGNIPVRVLRPGKKRWSRGHGIWVSDVFAWRASPAGWTEDILQVTDLSLRSADADEMKKLHRLDDAPVVAALELAGGTHLDVAARAENSTTLSGPFAEVTDTV